MAQIPSGKASRVPGKTQLEGTEAHEEGLCQVLITMAIRMNNTWIVIDRRSN